VQSAAQLNQVKTVVSPVDFEISASYGSQTVQANKFNNYVDRMISLPAGVDASNLTTGVVLTLIRNTRREKAVQSDMLGTAFFCNNRKVKIVPGIIVRLHTFGSKMLK
jgi:hypothetical protein